MALIADLRPFRLPLIAPLTTAHGTIGQREGILVSVTDGSLTGWGEATPMPGWSLRPLDETAAAMAAAVAAIGVVDEIADPRVEAILDELEPLPHARAALSGAIHDLAAQRRGQSLASTLGADDSDSVAVNGIVAAAEPGDVADAVTGLIDAGVTVVKLKVAAGEPSVDVDRVAAARAAAGPDVELRVDANGGWGVDTAVATLLAMSDHDITFCEEPTSGLAAIAEVGARSAVPVAIDESARTVDDIAIALGTGAIDVIVVKPQSLGGPDLAMRAITLATEFGASVVVTTMIDSAIGVAHAAHVAAASGSPLAHGLHTSSLLADDLAAAPVIDAGRMIIPSGPGLGVRPRFID